MKHKYKYGERCFVVMACEYCSYEIVEVEIIGVASFDSAFTKTVYTVVTPTGAVLEALACNMFGAPDEIAAEISDGWRVQHFYNNLSPEDFYEEKL